MDAGFKLSRVHPSEWLAGLLGLALIAGLLMPWNDGEAALASPGFVDFLLLLVAVGAVLLPLIVACCAHTDVPIVYETLLWTVSLPLTLLLLIKALLPPEGGFGSGFWLALTGIFCLGLVLWRSVAREF